MLAGNIAVRITGHVTTAMLDFEGFLLMIFFLSANKKEKKKLRM